VGFRASTAFRHRAAGAPREPHGAGGGVGEPAPPAAEGGQARVAAGVALRPARPEDRPAAAGAGDGAWRLPRGGEALAPEAPGTGRAGRPRRVALRRWLMERRAVQAAVQAVGDALAGLPMEARRAGCRVSRALGGTTETTKGRERGSPCGKGARTDARQRTPRAAGRRRSARGASAVKPACRTGCPQDTHRTRPCGIERTSVEEEKAPRPPAGTGGAPGHAFAHGRGRWPSCPGTAATGPARPWAAALPKASGTRPRTCGTRRGHVPSRIVRGRSQDRPAAVRPPVPGLPAQGPSRRRQPRNRLDAGARPVRGIEGSKR